MNIHVLQYLCANQADASIRKRSLLAMDLFLESARKQLSLLLQDPETSLGRDPVKTELERQDLTD